MLPAHDFKHAKRGKPHRRRTAPHRPFIDAVQQKRLAQPAAAGQHQIGKIGVREGIDVFFARSAHRRHLRALPAVLRKARKIEFFKALLIRARHGTILILHHAQPRFKALAELGRGIAHHTGIATRGAVIAHFQIILRKPCLHKAATNLLIVKPPAHFHLRCGGALLFEIALRHHAAQRGKRQIAIFCAQARNFWVNPRGFLHARVQLRLVAQPKLLILCLQIAYHIRSGHFCVSSVDLSLVGSKKNSDPKSVSA